MDSIDLDLQRDKFLRIFDTKIGEREGKEALRDWLLSDDCDFFIAPASTKYHGNYDGGLCEHSIDVYEMAVRLENLYQEEIRVQYLVLNRPYDREQFLESLTIAALFHDLCKVNFYKVKITGRSSCFTVDEQLPFGGHGSKSVYVLSKYLKDLRDEEAIAINCHMGFSRSDDNSISIGESFHYSPLAWIIHVADEAATFMIDRSAPQA
jgi:HD superfamily phosphohydrolase YqeK